MKFFAALKQAEFAAKLFAGAGLDLEKLVAAGDANALKAHLDSVRAASPSDQLQAALDEAVAENATLSAGNDALVAQISALKASLTQTGLKVEEVLDAQGALDVTKLNAQLESLVAKRSREQLAAAGHPPIEELPGKSAPGAKAAKIDPSLKGRDRYTADFNRQISAMAAGRN